MRCLAVRGGTIARPCHSIDLRFWLPVDVASTLPMEVWDVLVSGKLAKIREIGTSPQVQPTGNLAKPVSQFRVLAPKLPELARCWRPDPHLEESDMARRSKLIIAALAAVLVTTLGATNPAAAGSPDQHRQTMGTGGGWCC